MPVPLILYALTVNLVTFTTYAWDKSSARHHRGRTPERALHMLALLGGWPGALLAQRMLRHKSRKTAFRVVFWLTVVANLAAVAWLVVADAAAGLRSVLGID